MEFLKIIDGFARPADDLRVKTVSGAIVSLIAIFFMVLLFFSELSLFLTTETVDHLYVNTTRSAPIKVAFDLSFPEVPCNLLSVDILDDTGIAQTNSGNMVFKHRLSPDGSVVGHPELHATGDSIKSEDEFLAAHGITNEKGLKRDAKGSFSQHLQELVPDCGNCYGAGGARGPKCCNTCQEVREAYHASGWRFIPQNIAQCVREAYRETLQDQFAEDGGCQLYGELYLNRASGHFHIAPHKSVTTNQQQLNADQNKNNPLLHLLELLSFTFDQFNITHTVNSLRFGDHFPGIQSPLDGAYRLVEDTHGMYQYYVKIVPTIYRYLDGREVATNQYAVTEHVRHLAPGSGRGIPGIYFYYELSPMQVLFEERRTGIITFVTGVCAILGGLYMMMGAVDSSLSFVSRLFKKNIL